MRTPLRAASADSRSGGTGTSAQAVARYLVGLRPILADACSERNRWVRQLGVLIDQARTGNVMLVARGAGNLGREYGHLFREIKSRIEVLRPTPECDVCHAAVRAWTESLLASCVALAEVGRSGNLAGLRDAQEKLAEARVQARRFNDEYARVAGELRKRVAMARRQVGVAARR